MALEASRQMETFANPNPERNYTIHIECPEFTCLCPKTGQPDFAAITFDYVPDKLCIELKSLKQYFWSFRNEGHFHEKVSNLIADDLIGLLQPRKFRLEARFNVRGGLYTTIIVEHKNP